METQVPYTFTQCPCASSSRHDRSSPLSHSPISTPADSDSEDLEEDFDPKGARANYSLYPLDHLYYCEICANIRCQKCTVEEVVSWFCPNCLFEVPGGTVRGEGNRCTRSCFQCPTCTSPCTVTPIEAMRPKDALLDALPAPPQYVLSCACCAWTSKSIGITFSKNTGIYSQLQKHIQHAASSKAPDTPSSQGRDLDVPPSRSRLSTLSEERSISSLTHDLSSTAIVETSQAVSPQQHFAALRNFYNSQFSHSSDSGSVGGRSISDTYNYASPNALNRIMNLYTSFSSPSTSQKNAGLFREALTSEEGLINIPSKQDECARIRKLQASGYQWTASKVQRDLQAGNNLVRQAGGGSFTDELLPVPYLLRTKRTKRCRSCKHIVVRPEAKVQTSRFRMKMVASSYIPTLSIKELPPSAQSSQISTSQLSLPSQTPSFRSGQGTVLGKLTPGRTTQFLLTVKNPLYERARITLATPPTVPGRWKHRVTLLCPSFEIGAAREAYADVWDDALADPTKSKDAKGRKSLVGGRRLEGGNGESVAEAGKVFERGRNSVGVVVEVVPASLHNIFASKSKHVVPAQLDGKREEESDDDMFLDARSQAGRSDAGSRRSVSRQSELEARKTWMGWDGTKDEDEEAGEELGEDEDILEIPVRVRVEWEMEIGDVEAVGGGKADKATMEGDGERVKRELSYWVVLGVGRVNRDV